MTLHLPDPPDGSSAVVVQGVNRAVVTFPARGVDAAFLGRVAFCLLFAGVPLALGLRSAFVRQFPLLWALIAGCVAGGGYLLLSTFFRSLTRTIVEIGSEALALTTERPFWPTRRCWLRSEVRDVVLPGKGFSLAVVGTDGKNRRFPLYRSRAELLWLRNLLRQAMQLRSISSQRPPLPPNTNVTVESQDGATQIIMRPHPPTRMAIFFVCLVPVLMLAATIISEYLHAPPDVQRDRLIAMVVFVLLMCPVPFVALRLTRCPTTLEIRSDSLWVSAPRVLGFLRREWTRDQIKDINGGGANLSLRLRRRLGRSLVPIAIGMKREDIRWAMAALRHELRLPAEE